MVAPRPCGARAMETLALCKCYKVFQNEMICSVVRAMIKNKWIAFSFRLLALFFAAFGLARQLGIFRNTVDFDMFKWYTIQSNLLAVIMFAMLDVRTVIGFRDDLQTPKGVAWFARLRMVCSANLLLTLVVFWSLLAPDVPKFYLLSFDNLSIHVVTPLLCLADYILFYEAGRIKYRDVYFTCIFPLLYSIFVIALGFLGYDYGNRVVITRWITAESVEMYTVPRRAPYFFLDYDEVGFMVLVYAFIIVAFLVIVGHVFYHVDRRLVKKDGGGFC